MRTEDEDKEHRKRKLKMDQFKGLAKQIDDDDWILKSHVFTNGGV
jgi:hypothetical protein